MKLTRQGRFHNAGTDVLFDASIEAEKESWYQPRWDAACGTVSFSLDGVDRGNNYVYRASLGLPEVLQLLDVSLTALVRSKAERAVAHGAIASLRELLLQENGQD